MLDFNKKCEKSYNLKNELGKDFHYLRSCPATLDLLPRREDSFEVLNLLILIDLYHEARVSDVFEDITRIRTFLFDLLLLKLV